MKVAVVGAGPAGVRAVETLLAHGTRPVWIDEAMDGGGRIYQRPPAGMQRDAKTLYGFEAARATALHSALDAAKARADWRPETLVWNIRPGQKRLNTLSQGRRQGVVPYDAVILCTGAMDRVVPVKGWTLPGVTTMGGAQIALKSQGCGIGRRVAFLGSGPLLWLVAYQYAKAGAEVAAVLDTTPFATKLAAAPGMLRGPATFAKGLYYIGWLRTHGIRIAEGVTPLAIEGDESVAGICWRDAKGVEQHVACDAVGMGWGLKPEAQLADLAGIPFDFDDVQHNWVPRRDAAGRTPVAGVYLAGDGSGIGGAEVAELAGTRAALSLLQDEGRAVETAALDHKLASLARFRVALEKAFPFPAHLAVSLPDDALFCRCEGLTAGDLRLTTTGPTLPAPEMNRAKAFSRAGMGRCQGRVCGAAAAEILAAKLGCSVAEVGRLRGQAPVKPIPLAAAP